MGANVALCFWAEEQKDKRECNYEIYENEFFP